MNILIKIRYFFEIIALPFFIFLVIHIAGHGALLLFEPEHENIRSEEHENFLTEENLFGILFLFLFVWLWHLPALKKWVPCSHEHCHKETDWLHLFATIAFCLHFFPEAGIRFELMRDFSSRSFLSIAVLIGFFSHFLVDIVVAVTLSLYWKRREGIILSLLGISFLWFFAFNVQSFWDDLLSSFGEALAFLISAFLLSMFLHKPHKIKETLINSEILR